MYFGNVTAWSQKAQGHLVNLAVDLVMSVEHHLTEKKLHLARHSVERKGWLTYAVEAVVFSGADITELSLAFDQNMRATIAFMQAGEAKLYYYDTGLEAPTTISIGAGSTSPFLTMDDKREVATINNFNDILLFYIRDGQVMYRQQRDSYTVERSAYTLTQGFPVYIRRAGMNTMNEMQVELEEVV